MDKKTKGNIAEQKVILEFIKRNVTVSVPLGDNDSYDLIVDINNKLYKIQVKSAYLSNKNIVESSGPRRTLTNRKECKYRWYSDDEFDFAMIVYNDDIYIIPSKIFCSYKNSITLSCKRINSSKHDLSIYLNAWSIIGLIN